jgi:WD40 repeat protein
MKKILLFLMVAVCAKAQNLETVIQQGHELSVQSLAISPDSNFVATGSRDKSIKLWEVSTGREVRSFLGHELTVSAISFTSDGKQLVSGSTDKTVKIWDVISGRQLSSLIVNYRVTDIAIDPKSRFFVVGGYQTEYVGKGYAWDDSVVVVDLKTFKVIKKLDAAPDKGLGQGVSVAISHDGKWLAVGEDNRQTNVYSTSDWSKKYSFKYNNPESFCGSCISRNQFSKDDKFLFMVSKSGPLKKYSMEDGTLIRTYFDNIDYARGFSVSNDNKVIAIASDDELITIDENSGKEIAKIKTSRDEINEIAFTPLNGNKLLAASTNNIGILYSSDLQNQKELTGFLNMRDKGGFSADQFNVWQSSLLRYVRFKNDILATDDGKTLINGKYGTKIKRWEMATGRTVMDYVGHKKAALCFALSKDGKKLLTGGGDGAIILWNTETGDSIKVIRSYNEPIFDIKFNSDETKVATCGWDALMKIHDLETGVLEKYVDFETNAAYNLIFHPNDQYLFASRLDNSLQMWEMDTKTVVRNFIGHTDIVSSIRLSNDVSKLLTASWDGSIRLWDIGTGLMIRKIKTHTGPVHTAIWDKDEKYIYSAGADRTIKIYDINASKVIKTLEGHKAEISTLLFSPDNKMLISYSLDGVTKFWDLSTGKEFFEHIQLGEKDFMVKNPEGYFNGTESARQFIHFVDGMKTYSVDQFFNDFYRPDLLPKMFQERGSNQKSGLQGKLNASPPPRVKLATLPGSDPSKIELYIRMTDNGGGVNGLKIFHNGKSIVVDKSELKFPSGNNTSTTFKQEVKLVGGVNQFSCIAVNKDNIESDAQQVEVFSDLSSKNSICHVLAVGINQYKNPRMSLNYARPDAESFIDVVSKNGSVLFKDVVIHSLFDTEASKQNILKKLDELSSKINPEDVFVFYYAGHGSMVDNQFYFIPTESLRLYDASSLKSEAIEANVLQEKFKHIKALKQLIVMDACQSGGSVELLATRGASEEKAIAQLSRSAGIHVMASAGSEQFATEFAELGHGLFTYLLIKALKGDADGAPKDGKVTIYELKSYLDDQVPEFTRQMKGKPQYPYTFSRGQDFPVVIEQEK